MSVKQPFRAQLRNVPAEPSNFAVLDTAAKVATDANIGELVRPLDRAGEGGADVSPEKSTKKLASVSKPTTTKRLTADVPDYLLKDIHKRALENGTTIRYVVLEALRNANFAIKPEDLVADGRREN